MGLLEDNVPERYTCYICRDPPGQRQSLRYWYDWDWLTSGHMYGLSILENYSHQNANKITTTHQLLGDVHHVVENLNGLQLKMSILQSSSHPDLQLGGQPWKHLQRPWLGSDSDSGRAAAESDNEVFVPKRNAFSIVPTEHRFTSFQTVPHFVLESWLDYTGELEPPEPLARLPQLKHRIKRLLSQLSKVQQIALFSST